MPRPAASGAEPDDWLHKWCVVDITDSRLVIFWLVVGRDGSAAGISPGLKRKLGKRMDAEDGLLEALFERFD
jgi:hypothetical protein